jgi:hypothetical protein
MMFDIRDLDHVRTGLRTPAATIEKSGARKRPFSSRLSSCPIGADRIFQVRLLGCSLPLARRAASPNQLCSQLAVAIVEAQFSHRFQRAEGPRLGRSVAARMRDWLQRNVRLPRNGCV